MCGGGEHPCEREHDGQDGDNERVDEAVEGGVGRVLGALVQEDGDEREDDDGGDELREAQGECEVAC